MSTFLPSSMNYLLGLDWLSFYGTLDVETLRKSQEVSRFLVVDIKDFPTPQFLKKADIYIIGEKPRKRKFAEILFNPRLNALPAAAAMARIMNECLYLDDYWTLIRQIFPLVGYDVINISRVDIFCDFNNFSTGLKPQNLIKGYLSHRFLKKGINKGYLSFDNMGYSIPSNSKTIPANFKPKSMQVSSITWGRKGYVQTQLYNKTKELKEVKNKPWIVSAWELAHLDISNVWRVEFRIEKQGKGCLDLETEEKRLLTFCDLDSETGLYNVFKLYEARYFHFLIAGTSNRKARCHRLDLFKMTDAVYQPTIRLKNVAPRNSYGGRFIELTNLLSELSRKVRDGEIYSDDSGMIRKLREVVDFIEGQRKDVFPERPKPTGNIAVAELVYYWFHKPWYDKWKEVSYPKILIENGLE